MTENAVTAVVRTSRGLRDAIFDELDALRNGTSNPGKANSVAKLALVIVETVRMEVEVERHVRAAAPSKRGDDLYEVGKPLSLGG